MHRFTPLDTGYMLFALDKSAQDPAPRDDPWAPVPCWRTPQPSMHDHEDHEINIVVDGCTLYVWDDPVTGEPVRATVPAGQVFAIPGGVNHIVYVERKAVVHGLWIHPCALGKRSVANQARPNIVADPALFTVLRELFHRSEAETEKPDGNSRDAMRALGQLAGIALLRTLAAKPAPPTDMAAARVREVWAWLDRHYLERPTVGDLAKRAGMGRSQFCETFRKEVGQPPAEYVLGLRLRHSRDLLAHTDQTVASIADACGFASPPELNRAFRRAEGSTPLEFRMKCQSSRSPSHRLVDAIGVE